MKHSLIAKAIWGGAVVFLAFGSLLQAAEASITTSKPRYDVGEGMQILGTGFTAGAQISISVQRPDKIIDNVSGTIADSSGAFKANYLPPLLPGRYRITATDGVSVAKTATTEADAIGYSKGVYRKAQLAYDDTTGGWVTGNAGGNYRENQWAYYQYAVQGFGSTIPDFDVEWNHYESNVNAVFIDALANFRACVDCTEDVHTTGPDKGMLLDTKPYPSTNTTYWKNARPAISRINGEFDVPNSVCKDPSLYGTVPAPHNCFHVDGTALKALFPEIDFTTGTHSVTLYYQAHLASSFVWLAGKEYLLGCSSSQSYVNPIPQVIPAGTVYGTDTYSGGDPCALDDPGDMTGSYNGVSAATGSSRNFQLVNTGAGANGALTLPIPTVPPATGAITITKVTNPASAAGATFGFTSDLGPFNLDTDPATGTSNTTTFTGLAGGVSYLFTEATLPSGWTLTNLQCTGSNGVTYTVVLGSRQATVTLPDTANSTATCTFTNTGYGSITINKNTIGGDATFGYTTTGAAPVGPFNLTTSGGTATKTFAQVAPGAYTITESAPPAGWEFFDLACTVQNGATQSVTLGTRTANLTIAAGSSASCTYVNRKLGSLIIVKNTVGGNGTFGYTGTGTGVDAAFNLTTVAGTASTTFANLIPGAKSVTETVPAGWALTNLACALTVSGAGTSTFNTSTPPLASVTLGAGDTVTCTFTNTKQAGLIIVKNTVGGNGTFGYTGTGAGVDAAFNLTTVAGTASTTFANIALGAKSVTETVPAGWALTNLACALTVTGTGTSTFNTSTPPLATVTLGAGDTVTCTFTNTKQAGLIIVKNTVGGNGTFGYTGTGTGVDAAFNLTTVAGTASTTFANVTPGAKSVTETVPAGWALTGLACAITITGSGSSTYNVATPPLATVTLGAGDTVTCTFTNSKLPSLIVTKATVGGAGTFGYTGSGSGVDAAFNLTTPSPNSITFASIPIGAKSVEESVTAGWEMTSLTCAITVTGLGTSTYGYVGQRANVTLAYGDTVTCSYVNGKLPTLTIVKYSDGGPDTFTYGVSGPTPLSPSITTVGTPTGTGTYGPQIIAVGGPYNVNEKAPPAGWTMTDITCTMGTGGPDANADQIPDSWIFSAGYGDKVVCTFVNNKVNTTRTQGFWSTHTGLANMVWNSGLNGGPAVIGTADAKLCTANDITASATAGSNQLMGGFWSNVAQRTEQPKKRSDIDHARMQMLQQYFAAVLNHYAFGSGSDAMLANARTAYCTGTISDVKAQIGILGSFNESGDGLPFTPGASATAQASKSQANIPFWDTTLR